VAALARSAAAAKVVEGLGAVPLLGDLNQPESLPNVFSSANAEALVNIASLGFGHGPSIVDAAESAGIARTIFVSTTSVQTKLETPSKHIRLAAEDAIVASAAEWTIVRPTMIYGAPGDRNIERLLRLLARTPVIPIPGSGDGLQQPVHVQDLAQALADVLAAEGSIRRRFDLAGPQAITFRDLVTTAKAAVGSRSLIVHVPLRPILRAMQAYERRAESPRLKVEQLLRLTEDKAFSIHQARQVWGYDPRPFSVGVAQEARALWN
jgi:uncharacterized protein YbjT (DUF2867 family)